MALWMVRAGRSGEYEESFLERDVVGLTWGEGLGDTALRDAPDRDAVRALVAERYSSQSSKTQSAWAGMISAFRFTMTPGDLVVMPRRRTGSGYSLAEILSPYEYRGKEDDANRRHVRRVRWLSGADPIAKEVMPGDIRHSLGGLLTIYQVSRNDAEARFRGFAASGFRAVPNLAGASAAIPIKSGGPSGEGGGEEIIDLEEVARDALARHLAAHFSGHELATLVEAVLSAQGYTTYKSPPGPDGGMDLLASGGALGFEPPRILVQVKSGGSPVDLPVYTHMIGAMAEFHADQGLLVSWGGFQEDGDRRRATLLLPHPSVGAGRSHRRLPRALRGAPGGDPGDGAAQEGLDPRSGRIRVAHLRGSRAVDRGMKTLSPRLASVVRTGGR